MSIVGWSDSMAWLWTLILTRVGGLCSLLGQPTRLLQGRSYSWLDPSERDIEENDPAIPSTRSQSRRLAFERDHDKKTEEVRQLQSECSLLNEQIAGLEAEVTKERSRIEDLQKQLQSQPGILEAKLEEERAKSSIRIKELESELQSVVANREDQLKNLQSLHARQIAVQIKQFQTQLQRSVARREDEMRNYYEGQLAVQMEEVQKLAQQLELAEHQNSHDFAGGESFLDSGPTPHLLNKAVERVNQTSANFTKLLMQALKCGGVDSTKVGKELAPSVTFERAAHTKYVYQALVCKVLFTDFESECFHIEENVPKSLDPEQSQKDNFQRHQELISLENPEELVREDATDGDDFRRFCIKKADDLIAALSLTGAPDVEDVRALIFGPDGISKQPQIKLAVAFVKCALAVFLIHKLAFSMHPIARIFRLYKPVEFSPEYMEPVIAVADSDDEGADPIPLDVGFMVIPGFYVNRIIVHSRVYAVRRPIVTHSESDHSD